MFKNNLSKVRLNGKYGFINNENKIIIEIKYYSLGDFSDGLCIARENFSSPYGFLDELGNVAIEFKYIINDSNDITSFSCGLALIKKRKQIWIY
ncbi:MAG: WG repeat-containing protein [Saprospirales bacterium]|nr:WG repeat-containing protein [Saprospirales bacterium]